MKRMFVTAVVLLSLSAVGEAKQYQAVTASGKHVVVHTNPIPVAIHRILPPYGLGIHVYQGNLSRAR
ncbi:MAG: hypothetical protein ACYC35_02840 [Pirellulales bacterium]